MLQGQNMTIYLTCFTHKMRNITIQRQNDRTYDNDMIDLSNTMREVDFPIPWHSFLYHTHMGTCNMAQSPICWIYLPFKSHNWSNYTNFPIKYHDWNKQTLKWPIQSHDLHTQSPKCICPITSYYFNRCFHSMIWYSDVKLLK